MTVYAPKYFGDFTCVASECPHSCCVGWRIEADGATLEKYSALSDEYDWIKKSVKCDTDGAYIPLTENGRCPHLDERGLCKIISALGDDYITEICREHPRFYNEYDGYTEAGLGASCPEATRIILTSEHLSLETEMISGNGMLAHEETKSALADIIKRAEGYTEAEREILEIYNLPDFIIDINKFLPAITELEYLDEKHREAFLCIRTKPLYSNDTLMKKVLSYLLFRHLKYTDLGIEARGAVAFSLLSARIVDALSDALECSIADALIIFSEEIEYSRDNTENLLFEIESEIV